MTKPAELSATPAYHPSVRRLFLIAIIALLPLRGWASDFMAISMLPMLPTSAASQAVGAMPADCPLHAQAAPMPAAASAATEGGDISGGGAPACCACDLCLPLFELAAVHLQVAPSAHHAEPPFVTSRFVSAPTAQQLEPPIF